MAIPVTVTGHTETRELLDRYFTVHWGMMMMMMMMIMVTTIIIIIMMMMMI